MAEENETCDVDEVPPSAVGGMRRPVHAPFVFLGRNTGMLDQNSGLAQGCDATDGPAREEKGKLGLRTATQCPSSSGPKFRGEERTEGDAAWRKGYPDLIYPKPSIVCTTKCPLFQMMV